MSNLQLTEIESCAQSAPANLELPAASPVQQNVNECNTFPLIPGDHSTQVPIPQTLNPETGTAAVETTVASALTQAPPTTSADLSPQQHNALLLLLSGKPDAAVAATLGLSRYTILRWRLHSPAFRAELQQRREELYQAAADRLRTLVVKALMHFGKALDHRNYEYRHEAALQILRLVNTKKLADRASLLLDPNSDQNPAAAPP